MTVCGRCLGGCLELLLRKTCLNDRLARASSAGLVSYVDAAERGQDPAPGGGLGCLVGEDVQCHCLAEQRLFPVDLPFLRPVFSQ